MILSNFYKRLYTSLVLILLILLIFNFNFILTYCLLVCGVLAVIEFFNISKNLLLNFLVKYLINIFFIIYIFTFCFYFLFFANISGLKIILFILLSACVASDIGGFLFGKIFKGPKLTKISPKKTYSGSLGSIFFSVIAVLILSVFFDIFINFKLIAFAILTSIFCQIGDLFFSFLKRKAKLKDTGNILPGHGGILDRVDGLLLGIPLGFLTFVILN
jgi:phosphatidate cytidylyltransferase|tara:strand:- start:35 stop:685 length:651 start_codon:yes stop_codon:yes gene_type:complete